MSDAELKEREAGQVPEGDEITEADLDGLLAEETEETVRLELKGEGKSKAAEEGEEEEIAEPDFGDLLDEELEEELELEEGTEPETQRLSLERQGIATAEGAEVEIQAPLKRTFTPLEESLEITAKEPATEELTPSLQEIRGITEEQLEAVITRVVEDVVERVARETMTNVAEKLITEAIEALKKSIEPSPEG
jgi:hypothetical protein